MAPVAKRLSDHFSVIEPFQRKGDADTPLTVARHIADLNDIIDTYCSDEKPILAGHSWGAMLALAYTAVHPDRAASIVLMGCGTFDIASRERMNALRQQRMTQYVFGRLKERMKSIDDPDECLKLLGKMMMQVDSYDLMHVDDEVVYYDALGHEQTWRDMMRLQREGVYPAAFKTIHVPVLMLHGNEDPHPGQMIRDTLKIYLPQLEYYEWQRCGHYPWLEKTAHEDFYAVLLSRLMER
ncbi:MAG: alpha/beta hydrolase [Phycisphaerae bacterium]|nr:alpha/beta hydrolase [Phycisphaerae bacterium]